MSFVFPQELSTLPCTDFCDALQKKTHPSCRAPLVPGPQVADNPLIIRGFRSVQLRCVCGQGDDNVTSNLCNGRLVYLYINREEALGERSCVAQSKITALDLQCTPEIPV